MPPTARDFGARNYGAKAAMKASKSSSTREERAANAALAAIEGQRFYTWEKSDRKHAAMKEKDSTIPNYDFPDLRYKYRTNRGRNLSGDAPAATELPLFEYKPIPDEPNPRAPYFEMKIRGHTIWENTDIKLMCRVAGNPAPKVTWYHNKIPIEVSMHGIGKYKITQDNGIHYLEISRAQLCDAGNYRCSAQNYIGEVSDYAALTVKQYNEEKKNDFNICGPSESALNVPGYPRFTTKLSNQSVCEGSSTSISARVDGYPAPHVSWSHNGKPIQAEAGRVNLVFDGINATVEILNAFPDYEGEWTCSAFNSVGASLSKMHLAVTGAGAAPTAPTGLQVIDSSRNHVMLSWKRAGFTGSYGGAPIEGYYVQCAEAGCGKWTTLNANKLVQLTKYPATNLEEGKAYFFRVASVNRNGTSMWSLPVGPVACRDTGARKLDIEYAQDKLALLPASNAVFEGSSGSDEVPEMPTNMHVTHTTSAGTICVAFDGVGDGFYIEVSEFQQGAQSQYVAHNKAAILTNYYPVDGLEIGKQYQFRVRSENVAGFSQYSMPTAPVYCGIPPVIEPVPVEEGEEEVELEEQPVCYEMPGVDFIPEEGVKDTFVGPPSNPLGVVAYNATNEYLEVGWAPPVRAGGDTPVYFVEKRRGNGRWTSCNSNASSVTRLMISNLTVGEEYSFRVRASTSYGSSGFSEPSKPVIVQAAINVPIWYSSNKLTYFKISRTDGLADITRTSVKLCWTAPHRNGGAPITGYYLEMREVGGKWRPINNTALEQCHFTVDGLTPGRLYNFRIRASNMAGLSDYLVHPDRILTADPVRPVAVGGNNGDVDICLVGDGLVHLKWVGNNMWGRTGEDFTGYIVEILAGKSGLWVPANHFPEYPQILLDDGFKVKGPSSAAVQNLTYKVDGLVDGQTYQFRVVACSSVGNSAPSKATISVTMGESNEEFQARQAAIRAQEAADRQSDADRLAREKLLTKGVEGIDKDPMFWNNPCRLLNEWAIYYRSSPLCNELRDLSLASGQTAIYQMEVRNFTDEVEWFQGQCDQKELIVPGGQYNIIAVGTKRVLMITELTQANPAVITCVAKATGHQSVADLCVDGIAPIRFLRHFGDTWVKKGDTVVLNVNLSNKDAVVGWKKITEQGETVLDETNIGDKYELVDQGAARSLIIHDAQYEDIAYYSCGGAGGEVKANLMVDNFCPVFFDKTPEDKLKLKYYVPFVEFTCTVKLNPVNGNQQPDITWFLNDVELDQNDPRFTYTVNGCQRKIRINHPKHEESGEIKAYNPGGYCTARLEVEEAPENPEIPTMTADDMVLNFVTPMNLEANKDGIRIYCIISNLTEDIIVEWGREPPFDELPLKAPKYKAETNYKSGVVSLEITDISVEDQGRYTASFTTPLGMFDTNVHFDFSGEAYEFAIDQIKKINNPELFEEQEEEEKTEEAPAEEQTEEAAEGAVEETPSQEPAAE